MSDKDEIIEISTVPAFLTKKEQDAYRYWQASNKPALSASLQAKLFELFLNGKSTEEILRMNPALGLGEIVQARISGEWDKRLEDYRNSLLDNTMRRVQQSTLESVTFVCDLLAATNKLEGDKIKKYLLTGDDRELGNIRIDSLAGYGRAIDTLQKLTGQDKKVNVTGGVSITHKMNDSGGSSAMSSDDAAGLLKMLLGK